MKPQQKETFPHLFIFFKFFMRTADENIRQDVINSLMFCYLVRLFLLLVCYYYNLNCDVFSQSKVKNRHNSRIIPSL